MAANICKAPTGSHYTGSPDFGDSHENQVVSGFVHISGEAEAKRMVHGQGECGKYQGLNCSRGAYAWTLTEGVFTPNLECQASLGSGTMVRTWTRRVEPFRPLNMAGDQTFH